MNREQEVLAWLSRLVLDGWVSEEEAAVMFMSWGSGDLELLFPPPAEPEDEDNNMVLAAMMAGAVMGISAETEGVPLQRIYAVGAQTQYPNNMQDWWMMRSQTLAGNFRQGGMSYPEFVRQTDQALQTYLTAQHMGGYGSLRWDLLRPTLIEQRAYLQRFTDQIAFREHINEPYSASYIGNRLNLYGGEGRGEYYRGQIETRDGGGLIGINYIAVDDGATCSPCSRAQGFYDINSAYIPTPGSICLGGGHCRCRLEFVYAV